MVSKTVSDAAPRAEFAAGAASVAAAGSAAAQNSAALQSNHAGPHEAVSPESVTPLSGHAAGVFRCPRCRQCAPVRRDECGQCGFSFHETCSLEPAPTASLAATGEPNAGDGAAGELAGAAPGGFCKESLVGRVIGNRYRVLHVLGEGGFGVVYKVEFLLFDERKTFALKVLHPDLSCSDTFRRRFLREARLAMSLVHENAIQVREFGETDDGLLYYTMDFCAGETLKRVLAREGVLSLQRSIAVSRQILRVVREAHEQRIVHRDLKPENIFIERDACGRERVKVGDFGLAKTIRGKDAGRSEEITLGGIVGSPRYMSPEQASGSRLDERTDLFSVGMILYEALHASVPGDEQLAGGPGGSLARPVASRMGNAVDIVPCCQVVPDELFHVLRRALATDVKDRFTSAHEFIAALDALPAFTPTYRTGATRRRKLLVRSALFGLAAMLTLVIIPFDLIGFRSVSKTPADVHNAPPIPAALEAMALDSTANFAVEDYFPLWTGLSVEYTVRVAGAESDRDLKTGRTHDGEAGDSGFAGGGLVSVARRLRLEVVEQRGDNRFLVRAVPAPGAADHTFFWVIDREKNSVSREFTLPDPETGEFNRVRSRVLLKLPVGSTDGWNGFRERIDGEGIDVIVNVTSGRCEVDGQVLDECIEVIERDPRRNQRRVRYYQKGRGEVALVVYDEATSRVVYERVLLDPDDD